MNGSTLIRQKNKLLLPFSWLYQLGVWLHHQLYDLKIKKTYQPTLPVICVGNLSVGGTGKSPMVEYLLRLLKDKKSVATISRGYKRSTKGFYIANAHTQATDIGDEPMQFRYKFPDVTVAVGEQRSKAIQQLLLLKPATQVIILDDAFQHRAVQAGCNILLTEYDNLFTEDYLLPAGQLRDVKSAYKRAHLLVVTKCPLDISPQECERIALQLKPFPHQTVYFTAIGYQVPYHYYTRQSFCLQPAAQALLVTGIANPLPLKKYLQQKGLVVQEKIFADHHSFSPQDIQDIVQAYQKLRGRHSVIITTEKDAMRLMPYTDALKDLPLYVIPIVHQFLFDQGPLFDQQIFEYVG